MNIGLKTNDNFDNLIIHWLFAIFIINMKKILKANKTLRKVLSNIIIKWAKLPNKNFDYIYIIK